MGGRPIRTAVAPAEERFSRLLAEALAGTARPRREAASEPLATWLGAVALWNRKLDLTAARDDRELVDLMVADAALLAGELPEGVSVVDVGTGAGAPGLALALLRPDLRVTLVEPKQKRAAFLRTVLGSLTARHDAGVHVAGAPQLAAEVLQVRVEQVERSDFGAALSRATLAPTAWLEQGARLAPHGEVWVLLAREPAPELAGWRLARDLSYRWPLTGAERRAGCFRPDVG
jgi:16S rRNA (guanine527-N7)-methyltransferase